VLPHDPGGVPRRGARRRLRRASYPLHRRDAAREACTRRRRALLVPLHLQRLLPAAALRGREPAPLGALDRALAVPLAAPGAVEPDDGGDATRDGAVNVLFFPAQAGFVEGVKLTGVKGSRLPSL